MRSRAVWGFLYTSKSLYTNPVKILRSYHLLALGAVLLGTFIAFGASLSHGFAPLDDQFLIYDNLAIHGITLANLKTIFTTYDPELYIPLTLFSFQINYVIGGLDPFSFHLGNLLIHALNAFLVVILLRKLTGSKYAALFAGLLFAVCPIQTQTVVWITGRKDLLLVFFFLLSFLSYIRYRGGDKRAYIFSIVFFLLALLAKVTAVTLPFVLILYDLTMEKRPMKQVMKDKIFYLLFVAIFVIIAMGGKERIIASASMLDTIVLSAKSLLFYLYKLFLPINLSMFYPYNDTGLFSVSSIAALLAVAALVVISIRVRTLTFGLWFFFLTIGLTFFNLHSGGLTSLAADRYVYLPSIGILFLFAYFLNTYAYKLPQIGIKISGAIILAILCVLSIAQTKVWETPESLFTHSLNLHPESVAARIGLASIQRQAGKVEQAFETLREGLDYRDNARLRIGAGLVYAKTGQISDAVEQFKKARELDPENPESIYYLGSLREEIGNTTSAIESYRQAVEMDPSYVAAHVGLARLLIPRGEIEEAGMHLEEALRWNPSTTEAIELLNKISG